MARKKRYLFLVITDAFAGGEHFLVDYFGFINHDKYSVTLGVRKDVFSPYLKKNNLPVNVVPLPEFREYESFLTRLRTYHQFLVSMKADSVVFNQYFLRSFTLPEILAAFIATRGNAYTIVHDCPPPYLEHPGRKRFGFIPDWKFRRMLLTLLGYFCRKTIAVSTAARDALINLHRFPSHKVKVVYHGVNISLYSPSRENRVRLRGELGIPDSDAVIVSTAMLCPVKRVERLLKAFATASKTLHDLRLVIAGTGSEYEPLAEMATSFEKAIRDRIVFLGFRNDIARLLQMSDIYVLPSDSEGLPLACLEAMSTGLICIATDSGGTAEVIRDGQNGFLVERSEAGVTAGLQKVLDLCDEKKREISVNARDFVKQHFNLENNIRSGLGVLHLSDGL